LKFVPQNFRKLSGDNKPPSGIRNDPKMTLILVKESGEAMYARTRGDKDQLKAKFNDQSDLLLLAWTGQHSTDIFHLTARDLEDHYVTLGGL
jgi:hypothetical protein